MRPVVPAPSRLCAPLFLRLAACALLPVSALVLLPQPADAQAGYYSGPNYSGGTNTATYGSTNTPANDGPVGSNRDQWGGAAVTTYGQDTPTPTGSASCQGDITAAFSWMPAASSSAPPPPVIVTETTSTGWTADDPAATGDYSNPHKFPEVVASGGYGKSETGTWYSMKPGASSVAVTGSLTASSGHTASSSGASHASASVSYSVSASAVTLSLTGTTQDSSGNLHILIGQQCSPSLAGIPLGCTVTNLQWKATGNTVQSSSWNVSSGNTSATFSGLVNPYTLTQATSQDTGPAWYWDDSTMSQTVTCTATVTPPSGEGDPFTVTAMQTVMLDSPTFKNMEPVGAVVLNEYHFLHDGSPGHPLALVLAAGGGDSSAPPAEQANGITFNDTVLTPALYANVGSWYHLQLISVRRSETPVGSGTVIEAQGNAVSVALDYGPGTVLALDQTLPANGVDNDPDDDSPDIGVSDSYQAYYVKNEKFQDYIMYTPPNPPVGNSIAVPLAYFTWSWTVSVAIPSTPLPKSWANWNDRATNGVIRGPAVNSASRQLAYPVWTALRNLAWATQ